jgi:hypothetical protein
MPLTSFISSILGSRESLHQIVFEASRFSLLGVRAVVLSFSGALSLSYCKTRFSLLCGEKFTCEHLFSCAQLGAPISHVFSACIDARDFQGAARVVLSRFEVFLHSVRGDLPLEEQELFDRLNVAFVEDQS